MKCAIISNKGAAVVPFLSPLWGRLAGGGHGCGVDCQTRRGWKRVHFRAANLRVSVCLGKEMIDVLVRKPNGSPIPGCFVVLCHYALTHCRPATNVQRFYFA